MKETILVTAANGTVGSETIKILAGTEFRVRAGVHSLIKGDRFRGLPHVEMVHLDFHDPELLRVALTGVTHVFLITPFTQDQVEMAKKLVDVAKEIGVHHIVRLSASGADAEPGIQLGRDHREVEMYLESSGVPYTILRPAGFMQNFLMDADSICNNNSLYMPLGNAKVNYVDARDVAAVAATILTQPGHESKVYEITGPEAISVNDVAHAITVATNRLIAYVDVPEEAATATMLQHHVPGWMVNAIVELNGVYKAGYAQNITDTIEKLTGRQPRSIVDFAQDYSQHFQPN
ncbi:NAD(P)-dependent oxidoreductase [Adhaeribacter aerolatus]|uniref:NAD(P)-dependent oxidoreductase n=1 Tax=Adhaeribacter aerolatus TaxID=670289 RepID=A0A512ATP6_9BACT|nr:SDR family oxidoreductase [Adhaeribacter aerolatus]GEO03089.1 NAD(P)-dependent oxidoreductase [Adhaeribacter aerolatus]